MDGARYDWVTHSITQRIQQLKQHSPAEYTSWTPQAEEQPAGALNQRSKAAAKRARKKAARQLQEAAIGTDQQLTDGTAQLSVAEPGAVQEASSTCSSTPPANGPQSQAPPVSPPAATSCNEGQDAADLPQQSSALHAARPSAQQEWWRCTLSGRVMRDPVLYGSGGHSFERVVLEGWLAAHPGVDPLSRQPLPPGQGGVLANHALRNMIQQLHPC
jgi:U-box domain